MMTPRLYILLTLGIFLSSFLRVQAQCPTINSVVSTNVTCNPGPNNGTITITLNTNGYTGNYNYQILGIPPTGPIILLSSTSVTASSFTFTGLAEATYSVFVSPDAPCGNLAGPNQFITRPTVLNASTSITAACVAGTGAIDLTVTGGNGGNTFLWSPGGQVTEDINGLSAGSYSVTVTDVNSCSINVGPLIVPGPPTTGAISGDAAVCQNETGVAYSVPATAGSTYAWTITNGAQVSGTNTNSITVNWTATSPGNVQVVETNSAGCVGTPVTLPTTISSPPVTSAITGSTSVCINQIGVSYSVVATGGSTYAWTVPAGASVASGQGTASVNVNWASTSGNVQVIETNSSGCVGSAVTTAVTVNPANTVSPASSSPTLCVNTLMTNITHTTTGATGIGAPSGLPSGVSASFGSNTITISGTPSANGTFNYSIPLAGGCGNINATGTIVVTADNTASAPSSTPTLCINAPLTNITHTTTGATGISNDGVAGANGLPAGVSATWAGNLITISGTPTASGTFGYSIPMTGGCGAINATGTITVNAVNTVGPASSSPTVCINALMTSITHATTGATGIGSPTGLPAGVTASFGSNQITISGTPTGSGTFNYSIPLTGGCGSVSATGTIVVSTTNTASAPSSTPTLCINTLLTNITHTTTGAAGIGVATGLPAGVNASFGSNQITIGGTPSASGTFNYTIPLTGGCGSVNATGTITVTADNTVSAPSSTPTLCINTPLTAITHTTTGATGIGSPTGLPSGVTASFGSNQITISGTPTASGTFNYSIPLAGGCGSVAATGTISVTPANTASAPSSTPTVCLNVLMTDITHVTTGATGIGVAIGLPGGVSATFSGGTITVGGTPAATGTFNYSIPLTGGCGNVNATGTITVSSNNTVGAASSTPTVCVGSAMSAITHATTGATGIGVATGLPAGVSASFGANTITINGTPSATGTFNYSIPLTGGCGSATATGTITVGPLPTSVASGGGTVCSGATLPNVQFTFTGTAPFDFSYTDGTSTVNVDNYASTTYTIFNAPAGTYNVTALVDQGGAGCTQTSFGSPVSVVVTPLTVPTIGGPPPPEICQRTSVTFTTESGKTNYVWTFTGGGQTVLAGGSATDNSVTVSWGSTGAKTVNVRYTDNGCTSQITSKAITVRARPNLSLAGNASVCEGSTGNVYTTANGLTNYTWSVSPGGTITAGGGTSNRTATITWSTPGAQTVSVNATNTFGCTDDTPPVFNVTVNPLPSGQIAGTAIICSGTSTPLTFTLPAGTFDVNYTDGSGSFVATGISSGATVNVSPASTRTYTITSITSAAGCTVTAPSASITGSAIVTVVPSPSSGLAVSAQDASICSGSSTNILVQGSQSGISYQLRNDAGDVSIGTPVAGTGGQISLPTGALAASTTFNVFATLGGCSIELTQTVSVTVDQAPNLGLAVAPTVDPICSGGSTTISVQLSELGATYQLRDGTTNIGGAVAGTGGTILLPTGALIATTSFNVLVSKGVCTPTQLTNTATVNVSGTINTGLNVSAQSDPICAGSSTNIQVAASEAGINYQLRNNADNSIIGAPVVGTGGTIDLPTGILASNTTFNVLASSGTCSIQLTQTVTVTVTNIPLANLAVVAQSSSVCPSTATNIDVQNSESGVTYQLRNDAGDVNIGSPVAGSGSTISLPTGSLSGATTFNVLATRGTCSTELTTLPTVNISPVPSVALAVAPQSSTICSGTSTSIDVALSEMGVNYQLRNDLDNSLIGSAQPGNGGTLSFPTGNLAAATTYNILATLGSCSAELTQLASVTVNSTPTVGLTVLPASASICAGSATNVQVSTSEVGVDYQLRNDADNSLVGGVVSGTGGTINLPTGNLASTTTFNVFASIGSCSAELTQLATVTVNAVPSSGLTVSAQASSICAGTSTNIQVASSVVGVNYQLRNDLDDSLIGSAVAGDGGTINLNTGTLAGSTTFNVLATLGSCSIELTQTSTVTVIAAPNLALTVSAQATPICSGTSTSIDVTNSEVGVSYQLRNDADDSFVGAAQAGTGGTLSFATGVLSSTTVYNVLAQVGACSLELTLKPQVIVNPSPTLGLTVNAALPTICAGDATTIQIAASEATANYQLRNDADNSLVGSAVAGTGGTIGLPTGNLMVTTTFNVLVSIGSCSNELTQQVTVTTVPGASALLAVTEQVASVCSGSSTNIQVANSEVGVSYQLRNDADDSAIGSPVAGDGSTILLPTGALSSSTTFNVLASSASCNVLLVDLATVNVDNAPNVSLSVSGTSPICQGQSSIISLNGSESGVSYQLRDGTTAIGAAIVGTGGTINFGTGVLMTTTTFNILATRGVCTPVQLSSTSTVTVNPIPGNDAVSGSDTWIAYVYDDGNITSPASVDFIAAKYRGFFTETELDAFGSSTYDLATDEFDLNLSNNIPAAGPNICGSYLNDYSIRFRMSKTMAAGVYTFTLGGDDGIRIFIDGAPVTLTRVSGSSPSNSFTDHAYGLYTSNAVCLTAGSHDFVIEYYENGGFSRASFAYQAASAPTVSSPMSACVNSSAPTLTASSTDPGVTGYNWYSDSGLTSLVASTQSYTPSASDLDMTVAGTSDFYVVTTFACGQSQPAQVDVTVINTASIAINPTPVQVCQSATPFNLASVVTALPGGGTLTFGGTGVAGSTFDASQAIGSYPITVSYTAGGCSANSSFTVDIINTATITVPATDVTTCQSALPIDLTTLVSATPIGGSFVFTGAGVSGNNFDPSAQTGLVTITVDYSIGTCADTKTFNFNVVTSASLVTSNTVVCPAGGAVNLAGLVSASPSGGTFTFTGSPAITGNSLDPSLVAGSIVNVSVLYTVGGCSSTGNVLVSVRTAGDPLCSGGGGTGTCATVVITPVPSPATCTLSDGSITFNINPAVPIVNNTGVKITIDGISTTNQTIARTNFNDPVFPNLPIGTYDYSIEYGDPSCIKTGQVTIDRSGTVGVPTLSNVVSPTCFGTATGSVTIDVPGETGNPLEWSLDGTTWLPFVSGNQVTGIPAGDVIISVRRNSSDPCASGALLTMPAPVEIATTVTATAATCNNNDGTILVGTITGGTAPYTFEFNGTPIASLPTADTFTGLTAGTYTLRIIDALSCAKDFTVVVAFPGFVNHTAPVGNALGCSPDGKNGTITFTISDPGTYLVGYTKDAVAEPTNYFDPLNPVVNISGLDNGDWYVWIKPGSGSVCATKITTPIAIQGIVPVTFSDPASVDLNCASDLGSVLIQNVTGAPGLDYSYELVRGTDVIAGTFTASQATGAVAVPDLAVGDYTIRVMQLQSSLNATCTTPISSVVKNFSITSAPQLDMQLAIKDASCSNNDGSIIVESITGGVGPYTFELDGNPVLLSTANAVDGLSGNTYTLSVIDSKGCRRDYASLKIDFPGYIDISTPVGSSPSCLPDGSNGVISFQINQAGSYLVGYTTDLAAEPTNYFNPASQNVLIPGLANGNWFIWMKRSDGSGCVTKYPDPISIEGVYPVQATSQASDISCFGDKASILLSDLGGAPGVDFTYTLTNSADNTTKTGSISFAQSLGEFRITDLTPGNYALLLSQDQSSLVATCTSPILSESVLIDISGPSKALDTLYVVEKISLPDMATGSALIGLSPSGTEPYEASIELMEPILPGQSYFADWTAVNVNAQNLKFEKTFVNLFAGVYELNIRDAAGCAKTYEVKIDVDTNISIPNIFTPNGDGVNDIFYIRNLPTEASLVITNRWGKEVFRSGSYQNDWGGGETADGVYFYKLSLPNDSITGWVEILRGK